MKINYDQCGAPASYACDKCGVTGVKLWRKYSMFEPDILCAGCAGAIEQIDVTTLSADGTRVSDVGKTDKIGNFVPAVPDEEDLGWWGYSAIPDRGIQWWRNLPNFA